jgi:hypothetical protein
MDFQREQRELCKRYSTTFYPAHIELKIGIARDFDEANAPLNGLRHPPAGDTTGWYIWSGTDFSSDSDYFVPLHLGHLIQRCPTIAKFFGLPPGWRFLCAADYEDVWYDSSLLDM